MNREIVWTTQFKKDYKLALKRHLLICWMILSGHYPVVKRCRRRTKTIRYPATGQDTGNVISSRIGY